MSHAQPVGLAVATSTEAGRAFRENLAAVERSGAEVELRRYPGMPHTINDEELAVAREYLQRMTGAAPEDTR